LARVEAKFGCAMMVANGMGGAIVFFLLGFLLPRAQRFLDANIIALVSYMLFSFVGCAVVSGRAFQPIRQWMKSESPATSVERTYVVRHPLRQGVLNFVFWMGSELVFVPINARYGALADADVAATILMGAITTCGLTYLLAERILRPINEMAFADGLPSDPYVPGVKSRMLLTWGIGTGIPLLGVVLMAADHGGKPISVGGLAFLGIVGIFSGAIATIFTAKSIADPVESVTAALADVEAGQLDINVPVYDASQIGQLQSGFNSMVDGLRERRRLRDLFGRQVGEDVARQALERGIRLGGDQVHAAILFVDIIGSTTLAATRPPTAVMAALNDFFAIVVDVVGRAGGAVNKFEGDAALCIFGVPVPRDDADTCALLAARLLCRRLTNVNGLSAAIGVSSGIVVAGNVGTRERFEFTVVGDPVNEAARLTELAKSRPERLLVSANLLTNASEEERAHWQEQDEVVLRGRRAPTRLAVTV
jgi:adenylate cyclase